MPTTFNGKINDNRKKYFHFFQYTVPHAKNFLCWTEKKISNLTLIVITDLNIKIAIIAKKSTKKETDRQTESKSEMEKNGKR